MRGCPSGGDGSTVCKEPQKATTQFAARISIEQIFFKILLTTPVISRCHFPNPDIMPQPDSTGMAGPITLEIIGLNDSECCPFPCDENRTCGLSDCYPTGKLTAAFDALAAELKKEYGERVECRLTLVDDHVPDYVKKIVETEYPPLPMILVNGKLARIGRIVLSRIKKEIDAAC
jgi:hypothetical protein